MECPYKFYADQVLRLGAPSAGLDHRVRTVAARDHQPVILYLLQQAEGFHVLDDAFAGLVQGVLQ